MESKIKNLKLYIIIGITTVLLMFLSPLLNEAIKANTDRVPDIIRVNKERGLFASKNKGKDGYNEYVEELNRKKKLIDFASKKGAEYKLEKWKHQTGVQPPHKLESNTQVKEAKSPKINITTVPVLNESYQYDPVGMAKLEKTAKRKINYTYTFKDIFDDLGAFCVGWNVPLPATTSKNLGSKSEDGELERSTHKAVENGLKGLKSQIIRAVEHPRYRSGEEVEFEIKHHENLDVSHSGLIYDDNGRPYYTSSYTAKQADKEAGKRKQAIEKNEAEAAFNEAKQEIVNGTKKADSIPDPQERIGSENFDIQSATEFERQSNVQYDISPKLGYIGGTWLEKAFWKEEKERFVPNRIDEELYLYTEGMLKGKKALKNGSSYKRRFPGPLQYAFYQTPEVTAVCSKYSIPLRRPNPEIIMHPDYVLVKDGVKGSVADQLIYEGDTYTKFIAEINKQASEYNNSNLRIPQKVHIDSGSQKNYKVNWKPKGKNIPGSNQRNLKQPGSLYGTTSSEMQKVFKNPKFKYLPKLMYGKSPNSEGSTNAQNSSSGEQRDLITFNEEKQQWIVGPLYLDYKIGLIDEDVSHKKVQVTKGCRFAAITDMKLKGRYDRGTTSSNDRYAEGFNYTSGYEKREKKTPVKSKLKPTESRVGSKYAIEDRDEQENLVDIRSWDIYYAKAKKTYKRDRAYKAPYPDEVFYLAIDYDDKLLSIDKFRVEFAYMTYAGEMQLFEGSANSLEKVSISKEPQFDTPREVTRQGHHYEYRTENVYDEKGEKIGEKEVRIKVSDTFTGYLPNERFKNITKIKGTYKRIKAQPLVTYTGARWYEFVMLDADLKLKTEKNSNNSGSDEEGGTHGGEGGTHGTSGGEGETSGGEGGTPGTHGGEDSSIGSIPIGGRVWEDKPQDAKHIGYDHIFKRSAGSNSSEYQDAPLEGIRVRVNRLLLRITPETSKDTRASKIEEIVSKEEARLYKTPKNKDRREADEVTGPVYTNKNGTWGTYYLYQIGLTKEEKQKYPKNHIVKFEVVYDYDGIFYEPVIPLQLQDGRKGNSLGFDDSSSPNGNKYNDTTTAEKKKYFNSSFVAEDPKSRDEFSKANAEIMGKTLMNSRKETTGQTRPSLNGKGEGSQINYKGKDKQNNTDFIESEYQKNNPKENENLSKEQYYNKFMEASTMSLGLVFPTTDKFTFTKNDKILDVEKAPELTGVGGIYSSTENMKHINMGLKKRWVDVGLTKNLNNVFVTVNKKASAYSYKNAYSGALTEKERNELFTLNLTEALQGKNKKENKTINLYKTDYIYRTSMYSSNPAIMELINKELEKEKALDEKRRSDPRQLDVFLEYNVTAYNDSLQDAILLSQINDIATDKMELVSYEIQKVIQKEDPEENVEKNGGNLKEEKIKISKPTYIIRDSKQDAADYNKIPKSSRNSGEGIRAGNELNKEYDAIWKLDDSRLPSGYGKNVYQTKDNIGLSGNNPQHFLYPGEKMEFKLVFRVKNAGSLNEIRANAKDKSSLGILNNQDNGIEMLNNALKVGDFTNVAEIGAFASYDIMSGQVTAKIDKDSAPSNYNKDLKLKEDDTDEGETIKLRIPQNNEKDKKRVLKGTLFEDLRNTKTNSGIITGDGKLGNEDRRIPDYPVMLEERVTCKEGDTFEDKTFVWPEEISTSDIRINLKKATGFESVVNTDKDGNYTFTGVPSGNFVLSTNYTSPNADKIKEILKNKKELNKRLETDPRLNKLMENIAINKNDLKTTQNNNIINRKEKWYNGIGFKNTMFYNNGENNKDITWLNKKRKQNESYSFARDDEARRMEMSAKFDTFKNDNSEMLSVFREPSIDNINDGNLKEAHKHTTIKTMTPKLDFSVDYFENIEKATEGNRKNKKEYQDGIGIIYEYTDTDEGTKTNITYEINNINLGIVERPHTKAVLNKEITNLKLITADGNEIIDLNYTTTPNIENSKSKPENNNFSNNLDFTQTLNGVKRTLDVAHSKGVESVLTLDRTSLKDGSLYSKINKNNQNPNPGFRYINMDDSLLQDATLQATYDISVYNLSEIDEQFDKSKFIQKYSMPKNNIIDWEKKIDQEYRKEAYYKGILDQNNRQGILNHELHDQYRFGNYVGNSYYKPSNIANISKMKVKSIADFAANSTVVKFDNENNKAWQGADKKDLIGLIRGVKDEKSAKEAKYLDSKGEEYIKDISHKNTNQAGQVQSDGNLTSNILLLKEESKELVPKMYNEQGSSQIWKIQLSKTFSSASDKNISIENVAELLAYTTGNGKNNYDIPGNYITELDIITGHGNGETPGNGKKPSTNNNRLVEEQYTYATTAKEIDVSSTEVITVSPPTGLSNLHKRRIIITYILIGLASLITIAVITIGVIKRRKRKSKIVDNDIYINTDNTMNE